MAWLLILCVPIQKVHACNGLLLHYRFFIVPVQSTASINVRGHTTPTNHSGRNCHHPRQPSELLWGPTSPSHWSVFITGLCIKRSYGYKDFHSICFHTVEVNGDQQQVWSKWLGQINLMELLQKKIEANIYTNFWINILIFFKVVIFSKL